MVATIRLYSTDYEMSDLDAEEQNIFENQFEALLNADGSVERQVLRDRKSVCNSFVRAAKYALDNKKFKGFNPADMELGFGLIRPGHTKVANVVRANWFTAVPVAGPAAWVQHIGGPGAAVGFQLSEDHALCITHLTSLDTPNPLVVETRFANGREILIPYDMRSIALGDNDTQVAVYPIPTVWAMPESILLQRIEGDRVGNTNLKLGGITVGTGRFMSQEDYTGFW